MYRFLITIGSKSSILMNVTIRGKNIKIGTNCVINSGCLLDGRGSSKIIIGNNVDIAPFVKIWSVDHNPNSSIHEARSKDVIIEDNCWVASSVIILPGITLAEGTVVAAGSVVVKSTEPYSIVGGIPAKFISNRNRDIEYKHFWRPWFE
ncbi:acyltransferase [Poseidonibacter lekithochrous]|uniref:acyltransferase n=2 Tax=Poseidonibacter lekithochrous TaxID=1904463 RepID=UPI0013DADFF8|nr:acyltransferase [Poseidonibacter lekithochrous]